MTLSKGTKIPGGPPNPPVYRPEPEVTLRSTTFEAAGVKVAGVVVGFEKADGRTPNPGVTCSPRIPGAPPNLPVNLVELFGI